MILFIFIPFEFRVINSKPDDWQGGHCNVVHLVNYFFVEWLTREDGLESEHELHCHIKDVLVETVVDEKGITTVCLSTVAKE